MWSQLRPALVILACMTVLTGLLYPLLVTGIAQVFFARQAGGSLIVENGQVLGSELIGQAFDGPHYFWPRPSATTPAPYTAYDPASGAGGVGSNLGPLNPALAARVRADLARLAAAESAARDTAPAESLDGASALGREPAAPETEIGPQPPIDLLTASGSGLDPHISPAAAEFQAARVARARGLDVEEVRALIRAHTEPRQFGLLGEPRVQVVRLNLALDARTASARLKQK